MPAGIPHSGGDEVSHERGLIGEETNIERLDLATIVADRLQNLLDFAHEAIVEDRSCKLDDAEMTRTLIHVLFTGVASEVAIDCSEMRIVRTFLARSEALLIPVSNKVRNILIREGVLFLFSLLHTSSQDIRYR